jgi:uncharacterized protein YbjT (DUF2867 family)
MASNSPDRVFVVGSTGDVGSQVLPLLQKASIPTRLLIRHQDKVKEINDTAQKKGTNDLTEAIHGDLTNTRADALSLSMRSCRTLLLITPATPTQLRQNKTAIDAAILTLTSATGEPASDGINWIIRLSASDRRPKTSVPWAKAHYEADRYLEEQATKHGINWTVVAPSAFMSNVLELAPAVKRGFLPQASGDGKAGWVDTRDVAEVCAKIVSQGLEKHAGKEYTLTGPELLGFGEIAGVLEKAVGHRVRYVDLPGPVFGAVLRFGGGLDPWHARGLVRQFTTIIKRHDEGIDEPSGDVKKILGREPGGVEAWVKRNKKAFEGGSDLGPTLGFAAAGFGVGVLALGAMVWMRSSSG